MNTIPMTTQEQTTDKAAERFPRSILIGATALVVFTIIITGTARLTGTGLSKVPQLPVAQSRELRFEDRADGSIAVYAAADAKAFEILNPGTSGFVRNVMRSMARERKTSGIGNEKPFRLVRFADGRLAIEDPATGRTVDLGAFGSANTTAFARLMGRESTQ